MRQFVLGVVLGSVLTGSFGLAGGLYDRQGNPAGPAGSIQSFDYFRGRQQQLDVAAMRRQMERERENRGGYPCDR